MIIGTGPTSLFAFWIERGVSGGDGDECATDWCHCKLENL